MLALAFALPSEAGVTVNVGFLNPRMQVFVVGDILDGKTVEDGGGIGLEDFRTFFSVTINATADLLDQKVYVHLWEDLGNDRLIDYWSDPTDARAFTLRNWIDHSPDGSGRYSNTDLSGIETSDWYKRDYGQTEFADVSTVLENIENGLFRTATFTLGIEVLGLDGASLAQITRTINVYNPANPQVNQPQDGATLANLNSIPLSWSWPSGGATAPSDWTLTIVDAGENRPDDNESVIANRTQANTRFNGTPSSVNNHNYTGTGSETPLVEGRWHVWQVVVRAPATLDGAVREYASEVRSFRTPDPQVPDPRNVAGINMALYNALMTQGGRLNFLMDEDALNQLRGFAPIQVLKDNQVQNDAQAIQNLENRRNDITNKEVQQ